MQVAAREYFHYRLRNDSRLVLWRWRRMLEKTEVVWQSK